jgi:MFS transporter, MHS family, citrate/tricarballylate:H+ symporter
MTDIASGARPKSIPVRHVAAVVVGNALEFYDFLTYGYFAVYIGRTFFPMHSAGSSLLLSLATFGAGFLARPVGAIVIGSMGDRIGRKPAMMLSFSLMGIAIIGLALTPSYGQIGAAAPILVLIFRLLQGFALGGEVGPTTAFLVEAAPPNRRGFYAAMQYTSQDVAVLSAGLVGTLLASQLDAQQLQDWGWRVAMLLGACIVPFGLMLRRTLPETLHAADDAALAPDATSGALSMRARLRPYLMLIVLGLVMLASGTIGTYVLSYMTTYALVTLHMAATVAFGAIIVNGLFQVLFEPTSGFLSDKFGRKPVMLIPGFMLLLSIFPAFWVISHYRTTFTLYAAIAWLSALLALSTVPVVTTLTESLPKSIRSGTVATVYAFAISIFGGSTQFTVTRLLQVTDNPLAPAFYWSAAAILGLIAMALVKESAPVKLRGR